MRELLTSFFDEAKTFRQLIRTYNNHLGFTSFGVKCEKNLSKRNKGVYTFKVQGQVYHFLNNLTPASNPGSNMQLYFHDVDNELSNHKAACPRLSKNVIKKHDCS